MSTETLEIPFIAIMVQTGNNTYINTQVNFINTYPFKYQGTSHLSTSNKNALGVDLTTKKWYNYWCSMSENWKHYLSGGNCLSIKIHNDNSSFSTIIQDAFYSNFRVFSGFVFCRKLARTKTQQGIDKVIKHNSYTSTSWDLIFLTCKSTGVVSNSPYHLSSLRYTSSPFAPTSHFASASATNRVSRHWEIMPPLTEYSDP